MVERELNEVFDELEWCMLWSGDISKEVSGGGIKNIEDWGKLSAGDLVEEDEVKMEVSTWIKIFCGKIGVTGQTGSHGNKKFLSGVGELGDIIWWSYVYLKFGHFNNKLVGSMYKVMMG